MECVETVEHPGRFIGRTGDNGTRYRVWDRDRGKFVLANGFTVGKKGDSWRKHREDVRNIRRTCGIREAVSYRFNYMGAVLRSALGMKAPSLRDASQKDL